MYTSTIVLGFVAAASAWQLTLYNDSGCNNGGSTDFDYVGLRRTTSYNQLTKHTHSTSTKAPLTPAWSLAPALPPAQTSPVSTSPTEAHPRVPAVGNSAPPRRSILTRTLVAIARFRTGVPRVEGRRRTSLLFLGVLRMLLSRLLVRVGRSRRVVVSEIF